MQRKHRRKLEDRLVGIDGARVRAAIEWQGLSINGAAARMKVSQQTLDSIVRSKTKRCYQSLRDKLAKLLRLPPDWLAGESDLLPSFTPWVPLPQLGYTPPLWVDENMRLIRPPEKGDLTQRSSLAPKYQLAAHQLATRVAVAWKRDITDGDAEAKAALNRLGVGRWEKNPWDRATMLVTRLVSAYWWRRLLLLVPSGLPPVVDPNSFTDAEWRALSERMIAENQRRATEELEADNEFATAAVESLSTVLRPWFTGKQQLNYTVFIEALEWASTGFGKNPSTGGT